MRHLSKILLLLCLLLVARSAFAQAGLRTSGLSAADRKEWRRLLGWPAECEDDFRSEPTAPGGASGLEFFPLGHGRYVVKIACSYGAYFENCRLMYYDARRRPARKLLRLRGFSGTDDRGVSHAYSVINGVVRFDPGTRTLSVTQPCRGLFDCGLYVRYRFVGSRPIVIEARAQREDLTGMRRYQEPEQWPRIRLRDLH